MTGKTHGRRRQTVPGPFPGIGPPEPALSLRPGATALPFRGATQFAGDEGVFRVIHRKEVDPDSLPYRSLGPAHSFLRADAEPLHPGEVATIRFALIPTSVLLRRGHRIRLALAGADAGLFQRYPAEGTPVWTVHRDREHPSFLELPMRSR